MEEAGGVADPFIRYGNPEVHTISTKIEWPYNAKNVSVCVWDGHQWTWATMKKNQGGHSVVLQLEPYIYWFFFNVDGIYRHNPYLSWQYKDGVEQNFICVKWPDNQDKHYEVCPITYRHFENCGPVYVSGSWDNWKQRLLMNKSGLNHVKLIWLHPGRYLLKFFVDGVECLDPDTEYELDSKGLLISNRVTVMAGSQSHELYGNIGAAFLDDFMALPENEVSVIVKFRAGTQRGSIHRETTACPCTKVGYILLDGFFGCLKHAYMEGRSWAGCFKTTDMVVVDNKHCQIKKRASQHLTRTNFLLDIYRLEECLLLKYKKDNLLPPYFSSLFTSLEDPPQDFDSKQASKDKFLGFFDNQAALASPPRRMLSLVNMGQFIKQLPEQHKSSFTLKFNAILKESSGWQKTMMGDSLLKDVFVARRKINSNGDLLKPVPNTSLEATYALRVFFVHGPEHTFVNQMQILKAFAELDLVIAHHFERLMADFIKCVYDNTGEHVLIKAMWDFYCGGVPPDHLDLDLWRAPG